RLRQAKPPCRRHRQEELPFVRAVHRDPLRALLGGQVVTGPRTIAMKRGLDEETVAAITPRGKLPDAYEPVVGGAGGVFVEVRQNRRGRRGAVVQAERDVLRLVVRSWRRDRGRVVNEAD